MLCLQQISMSVCCSPLSAKMNPCNAKTIVALTSVFVGKDCIGLTTNAKVRPMQSINRRNANFLDSIDEDNLFLITGFVVSFLSVRNFLLTCKDFHAVVVVVFLIS